jgi:hypothetical protein
MPRNLADLSEADRANLLNGVWSNMVNAEVAAGHPDSASVASPVKATGPVPADLASHLAAHVAPSAGSALGAHAWTINGNCMAPGLNPGDKVAQPGTGG